MQPYDLAHPDYDRWLCRARVKESATSDLLHMLVSLDARSDAHYRWRKERCNPIVTYMPDLDRVIAKLVADELEFRIDRSNA